MAAEQEETHFVLTIGSKADLDTDFAVV